MNLKNQVFTIILFTIFLFSCEQSSKEPDNNATNVANKTNTNDTNTEKESIVEVINSIRYSIRLSNEKETIADYKATYPKSGNDCFLKIIGSNQYANQPTSKTENTQTFDFKDLEPTTLEVSYSKNLEQYMFYVSTRGSKNLIKSGLGIPLSKMLLKVLTKYAIYIWAEKD